MTAAPPGMVAGEDVGEEAGEVGGEAPPTEGGPAGGVRAPIKKGLRRFASPCFYSAPSRTRTLNLLIKSQMLYQLS